MHKRKRHERDHRRAARHSQVPKSRIIEIEPAVFATHIRQAEQEVIPIIKEIGLDPAPAAFLMAQYTQRLVTGDPRITHESAKMVTLSVLSLWQDGVYSPSPEYPYTLEETMQDVQRGFKAKKDYAEYFQRFIPSQDSTQQGLGQISGGVVRHPETNMWQIWMILDGTFACIGAFRDPMHAQKGLEEFIRLSRRGGTQADVDELYERISAQSDNISKPIPYDMTIYISENRHSYRIEL